MCTNSGGSRNDVLFVHLICPEMNICGDRLNHSEPFFVPLVCVWLCGFGCVGLVREFFVDLWYSKVLFANDL
jgi:hypothetical protein